VFLSPETKGDNSNRAYTSSKVDEMLRYFLECTSSDTSSVVTTINLPSQTAAPFPNIFSPLVDVNGSVSTEERPSKTGKICSCNLLS
jgi:hypothetical protein